MKFKDEAHCEVCHDDVPPLTRYRVVIGVTHERATFFAVEGHESCAKDFARQYAEDYGMEVVSL